MVGRQTQRPHPPTHPPPGGQAPVASHTWVLWVTLGVDAVRGHSLKHCSTWQAKGPGQAEGSLVVAGLDQRWQRLRGIVWQACAATLRGRGACTGVRWWASAKRRLSVTWVQEGCK